MFLFKMTRILRCKPNGIARRASHRFSVEYVTHRKRANSSCERPMAFLMFRISLALIFISTYRRISSQARLAERVPYIVSNSL